MKSKKIVCYQDLLADEFVATPKKLKSIVGDYQYINKSLLHRFGAFIAYRLIATPIAFIYTKLIRRIKFVNKKVLKPYKKQGYFIFANHTHPQADAFTPNIIVFPKRNYTVVNASNVSLPILGRRTELLGALPLPADLKSTKNFLKAIETRFKQGFSITIYPEAHLWPFYTKIRPFQDQSFKYPAKLDAPVFTFTTSYQTHRNKRLKTIIYIDGPFIAPASLTIREKQMYLHQSAISAMRARALNSDYEKIIYLPKEQS